MEDPITFGANDSWVWNRKARGHKVMIQGNSRTALFHPKRSSGTAAVRGTRVLNYGRFYWEVKVSLPNSTDPAYQDSIMFGIAKKKARLHADQFIDLIGIDKNSWGLSHQGTLIHSGKQFYYYMPPIENYPTTIGMLFDGSAGTLTFYKNGISMGPAFFNLNKVREKLYPVVSSTIVNTVMTLTIMKREVNCLKEWCRALIKSKLKRPSDIECLGELPTEIKEYLEE